MKRNTKKIILTAVIIVLVVALAVTAIMLLRKDSFGYNYFERNQAVAKVGDHKITKNEFAVALNDYYSNISTYNMYALYYGYYEYYDTGSEDDMAKLKADILNTLVMREVYINLADELGISLTDEEMAECIKTGKDALTSLQEECVSSASSSGATDATNYGLKIMSNYFANMGMNKSIFVKRNTHAAVASALETKVEEYYNTERSVAEDEIPAAYEKYVQEYYVDTYADGSYAQYENYYQQGYSKTRYLYVPEDFLFVRVIKLDDSDKATELMDKINSGEEFESILQSDDNLDTFIKTMDESEGYAIGAKDSIFDNAIYEQAAKMEIGEIGLTELSSTSKADDGTETTTYTYYIIERVEGQTGIVPYEKVSESMHDTVVSYLEYAYFTEKVDAYKEKANIELYEALYLAVKPVSA